MITKIELLPKNRCTVHVGKYTLEMSVKHALSQKKFARNYLNNTGEQWKPLSVDWYRSVMRKRFDAAGYDFDLAGRSHYGTGAVH